MKRFAAFLPGIAFFLLSIASSAQQGRLPKTGMLTKSNFEIHGIKVDRMTVQYELSSFGVSKQDRVVKAADRLGSPTSRLTFTIYETGGDTYNIYSSCMPVVYLKLVWNNRREGKQYIGWISVPPGSMATRKYSTSSLDFQNLIQTGPTGSAPYLSESIAREFYRDGEVIDFNLEENPICGAGERAKNEQARERAAQRIVEKKQQKEQSITDAAQARQTLSEQIKQLPPDQQARYAEQLRLANQIVAPTVQLGEYNRIQAKLATDLNRVTADKQRATAAAPAKIAHENALQKQIGQLTNSVDRRALQTKLNQLKNGRSTSTDEAYESLAEQTNKALETEKRMLDKTARFNQDFDAQPDDFKTRQGAGETRANVSRIQQDNTLTNIEKEARIEEQTRELNRKKDVYASDNQSIQGQKKEIQTMRTNNKQKAVVEGAATAVVAAGIFTSAAEAEVNESNYYQEAHTFMTSIGVGLANTPAPLMATYFRTYEHNDGTLNSLAKIDITQGTGAKVVNGTGLFARGQIDMLPSPRWSAGLFAEIGYHLLNFEQLVSAIGGESGSGSGSTTSSSSDQEKTSTSTFYQFTLGTRHWFGSGRVRGLFEGSLTKLSGSHNYKYAYAYTGSGGSYQNIDESHYGDINYMAYRIAAGARFGDMTEKDDLLLDIKAGRELTNAPIFKQASPWFVSFSIFAQHRFQVDATVLYGYFNDPSVKKSDKFQIECRLVRLFNWYKGTR